MLERFKQNPLIAIDMIKPSREDFELLGVFNPAAARVNDTIVLLFRVAERPVQEKGYVTTVCFDPSNPQCPRILQFNLSDTALEYNDPRLFRYKGKLYLTSISHLRLATSYDGIHFDISDAPVLLPEYDYEIYGIEDPRLTQLDNKYYITYCAVSPFGVTTCMATTEDFTVFSKHGIIFPPDNKDVVLFPQKVENRYYAFHRPSASHFAVPSMWIASSENGIDFGHHQFLFGPRPDSWDSIRVGCGPQPILTSEGWVELYHGANEQTRYCSGAVLLDRYKPWKVLRRSTRPFLAPEAPYETSGFMPGVVFCTGLIEQIDGSIFLYYGASDDKICGCILRDVLGTVFD